jgi:hypothetical protein
MAGGAVVLCCTAVSEAGQEATDLVPLVDAAPGPLSSVLNLLELPDRHGAECEELQAPLAGPRGGQWRGAAYAGHNRIGQQSLEGDTHGCGWASVAGVW